jgi:type VI secretion system secreted protein Hcp
MAIFMKYGGLKGETTAEGYPDWIELSSLQFGVGRGISMGVGGGSKREASAPSISEVTVTKTMDVADALLLKEAIGGKGVDVKIDITRTDNNGKHVAFQKYILSDTLLSGYSLSSGGERPSVSISLNFAKIDSEYLGIDSKFQAKSTGHVIYDLATAKLS